MGRVLAQTVVLVDDNGVPVIFYAGDEPEKKYADQIDNPKAWGDDSGGKAKAAKAPEPVEEEEVVEEDDAPEPADGDEPPRSGKGSGKEAWAAYAATQGIELEDGATAKDYQNAVDAL